MDLRHHGRGDQLAFRREGARIFEAPEAIPELERLRRALTNSAHAADPCGLAWARNRDDRRPGSARGREPGPYGARLVSTASAYPSELRRSKHAESRSAVTASAKPSAAVTKTRCEPSRTRATLAARAATISHAGRFGCRRLVRRFSRHLGRLPAQDFQRAKTCDGLDALDVSTAEVEDARHQPFLSFLA